MNNTKHPRDLTDLPFGRLIAKRLDHIKDRHQYWFCECECGGTTVSYRGSLLNGDTQSCGCLATEIRRANQPKAAAAAAKSRSHGPGVFLRRFLYNKYKRAAKKRRIKFAIDRVTFDQATSEACHYCGTPPSQTLRVRTGGDEINYSGVDRIDPNRGYEPGNVRPCCWLCNAAKARMTESQFRDWVTRVYHHFGGKSLP